MFNRDDDDVVEHLPVDIDKYVNAIELVTQIKHPHNCMIVIIIDDFVFLETEFKKKEKQNSKQMVTFIKYLDNGG